MRINVAQQLKGLLGERRDYAIEKTTHEGYPVEAQITLVRTHRSILATGKLSTVVQCVCSRCLKEFDQPLEFKIEEEFFPVRDVRDLISDLPTPVTQEDADGFVISEDHILDLSEAVRQNILLNLPVKPVCQPNCAGLCHYCGQNLNYGSCHCSKEPGDPRLSPLREIFSSEMAGGKKRG